MLYNEVTRLCYFCDILVLMKHYLSTELMLEWKANVRAVDSNKNTALHLACQRRHSAAASLLLNWIENCISDTDKNTSQSQRVSVINMINKQQRTPLHLAARNGLVTVN